jgi:hypothetical protein
MSGKATIKNFADILGTAKLPEKTIPLCMRGDLAGEFDELERQLEEADKDRGDSLDAGAEVAELVEQIEALQTEMKEHTYTFRVRALSRRAYRALVAEHPPREVVDENGNKKLDANDEGLGFNVETFFEALLRVALVDPDLDDASWDQLLDTLTDRQFEELAGGAWLLNRAEVDIPFSPAASRLSRNSSPE